MLAESLEEMWRWIGRLEKEWGCVGSLEMIEDESVARQRCDRKRGDIRWILENGGASPPDANAVWRRNMPWSDWHSIGPSAAQYQLFLFNGRHVPPAEGAESQPKAIRLARRVPNMIWGAATTSSSGSSREEGISSHKFGSGSIPVAATLRTHKKKNSSIVKIRDPSMGD